VYREAIKAFDKARSGGGPSLIECLTYRHSGHSRADPAKYRPDTEVREAKVPAELQRVFRESKRLQKFYESLNYSTRRDIGRWVGDAKHAETRVRRAEQLAERMMQVMEAERELPPVMQLAMAGNPKAHAGWRLMTPSHRRSHLFGIFHYQNPESRARRLAKAIEMMVQYAEKRENHS